MDYILQFVINVIIYINERDRATKSYNFFGFDTHTQYIMTTKQAYCCNFESISLYSLKYITIYSLC